MSDPITCAGGCKRSIPPADAVFATRKERDKAIDDAPGTASGAGWSFLPIQQRWRCPTCEIELNAANGGVTFDGAGPVATYQEPGSLDWEAP